MAKRNKANLNIYTDKTGTGLALPDAQDLPDVVNKSGLRAVPKGGKQPRRINDQDEGYNDPSQDGYTRLKDE
jgi:hypothetical protein